MKCFGVKTHGVGRHHCHHSKITRHLHLHHLHSRAFRKVDPCVELQDQEVDREQTWHCQKLADKNEHTWLLLSANPSGELLRLKKTAVVPHQPKKALEFLLGCWPRILCSCSHFGLHWPHAPLPDYRAQVCDGGLSNLSLC